MLKRVGLPLLALAALLTVVPAQKANAAVRFGVTVGGPAYAYPAYPGPSAYPASDPYYNAYPPLYVAPAPAYVYGYGGWRGSEHRVPERYERRDFRGGRGGHESRGGRR